MKETERAMKEVHKFLQENVTENMSMDEINALLQAHLKEINANIPKGITEETAETADDFMELAEQKYKDGDEMGALRLARKAQKMDPDNLDIDLFLLAGEKGSVDGMKAFFCEQVLQKALDCFGGVAVSPVAGADPVSDLTDAVLLIEEIDDPDETPGLLQPNRKQVLSSRIGGKVKFLH